MGNSSTQPRGAARRRSSRRGVVAALLAIVMGEAVAAQQADAGRTTPAQGTAAGVVAPATAVIGARASRGAPARPAATAGRVIGTIRDAVTAEPLIGGQVAVRGFPLGNVSDDVGAYFINNVPPGAHTVAVEYLGYEPQAKELQVEPGVEATLDFALQPTAIEMAAIVVEEETVRDLSEYVEKTPRPEYGVEPLREVEVARSDTSLMEEWHRDMRDLTVVHAIEYPLAGTTVYFRRPKPLKPQRRVEKPRAAAPADSGAAAQAPPAEDAEP